MLDNIKEGGTFVLNSRWSFEDLEKELPADFRQEKCLTESFTPPVGFGPDGLWALFEVATMARWMEREKVDEVNSDINILPL